MAAAIRPIDAFDFSKRYIKNMNLETVQVRILDDVNKIIWMAAPWRWTVSSLPSITLVANAQDYPISLPNDFLYSLESYITDQSGGNPRDLRIEPYLPTSGLLGQPSRISFLGNAGTTGTARVFPKFGSLPPNNPIIISTYKKTAPTITPTNMTTAGALVMDDEWFHVYESGVLWLSYLYGDDQRAGSAEFANGTFKFTGQRALFEANIQMMRDREKILGTDSRTVPDARMDK